MPRLRDRVVIPAVLAALACGDGRPASTTTSASLGADAVLLRVPMRGGTARAHTPGRDSSLWQSRQPSPPIADLAGFDDFLGLLITADAQGRVSGINLRLGTIESLSAERLSSPLAAEGGAVFGLDPQGRVVRITPTATWKWDPRGEVQELLPTPDGNLVVLGARTGGTALHRLIPPEARVLDSATVPAVRRSTRTVAGDRLWFATDSGIVAVETKTLQRVFTKPLRRPVDAMVATPSGDRVFVAVDDDLRIIDRYAEDFRGSIALPSGVRALRIDPDGRYLLAQSRDADSVFVISIGTSRVVQRIGTSWRADLPLVTPDGGILLERGSDAVLVEAESGRERHRYVGGATDAWMLVRWNGFRPRAAGLDRPVEFEEFAADSVSADSAVAALIASRFGGFPGQPSPSATDGGTGSGAPPSPAVRDGWYASFATFVDRDRALEMASTITVGGRSPRVVEGTRDGVTVWRVLLGPYESRQGAELAGMSSRQAYWVFEGLP